MKLCAHVRQKKGYPFDVVLIDDPREISVVLADQVKIVDWKTRQAVKKVGGIVKRGDGNAEQTPNVAAAMFEKQPWTERKFIPLTLNRSFSLGRAHRHERCGWSSDQGGGRHAPQPV